MQFFSPIGRPIRSAEEAEGAEIAEERRLLANRPQEDALAVSIRLATNCAFQKKKTFQTFINFHREKDKKQRTNPFIGPRVHCAERHFFLQSSEDGFPGC